MLAKRNQKLGTAQYKKKSNTEISVFGPVAAL